jgi:hypothetical protein
MVIDNDADWRRAFAFWFFLAAGNLALVSSICFFLLVQISIKTQLVVFLSIGAGLMIALLLGRWKPGSAGSESSAERWRIGPWLSVFLVTEVAVCGLLVCGHIWAIITHYKQPPGAI